MSSGNDYWSGIFSRANGQSLQDAERAYLISNGAVAGSNQDMWRTLLLAAGYSGSHNDMISAWVTAGASFTPAPAYMLLDGTDDYADKAIADSDGITSAIDMRAHLRLDDWTPAATPFVLAHWLSAANYSWALQLSSAGTMLLHMTSDGTTSTIVSPQSTAVIPFVDGTDGWIRCTWEPNTARFYTSTDGSTWNQLGLPVNAPVGSIYSGSSDLVLGASTSLGAPSVELTGRVYYADIRDVVGGGVDDIIESFDPDGQVGKTSFNGWTLYDDAEVIAI